MKKIMDKKMKNFKMPKDPPVFGEKGDTQNDLEKQIEDELLDLKIKLNTDDFGKRAIEEDQKRESQKTKEPSQEHSKHMFDIGREEDEEEPEDDSSPPKRQSDEPPTEQTGDDIMFKTKKIKKEAKAATKAPSKPKKEQAKPTIALEKAVPVPKKKAQV